MLNKVPGVREALGVPALPAKSKARKPGAPAEPSVFDKISQNIEKAQAAASGSKAPTVVAGDQFGKKAEDNACRAARKSADFGGRFLDARRGASVGGIFLDARRGASDSHYAHSSRYLAARPHTSVQTHAAPPKMRKKGKRGKKRR